MDNDRDLRNVILLLVKACKLYKARAYTANKLLTSLMSLPPTKRAATSPEFVNSEAKSFLSHFGDAADQEAARIERSLEGDGAFLEYLRVYASQQYWK
jgi:hypothetical protein